MNSATPLKNLRGADRATASEEALSKLQALHFHADGSGPSLRKAGIGTLLKTTPERDAARNKRVYELSFTK
jgi:hypothetical protein